MSASELESGAEKESVPERTQVHQPNYNLHAWSLLTARRTSAGEDGAPAKVPAGKRARGSAARAQRTADKNRQAQKRYRERQSAPPPTFEYWVWGFDCYMQIM